jgi:glutamate synthase (NADPH/NADH) small chain
VGKKDKPVAIGNLERFAADWARGQSDIKLPPIKPKTGKKVAVVGSGPGGLTVAGDLIKKGHEVTVFEALHKPGGVLVYGIPSSAFPRKLWPMSATSWSGWGSSSKTERGDRHHHHGGRAFGRRRL